MFLLSAGQFEREPLPHRRGSDHWAVPPARAWLSERSRESGLKPKMLWLTEAGLPLTPFARRAHERRCVEHVRRPGGVSPPDNLMEVKSR